MAPLHCSTGAEQQQQRHCREITYIQIVDSPTTTSKTILLSGLSPSDRWPNRASRTAAAAPRSSFPDPPFVSAESRKQQYLFYADEERSLALLPQIEDEKRYKHSSTTRKERWLAPATNSERESATTTATALCQKNIFFFKPPSCVFLAKSTTTKKLTIKKLKTKQKGRPIKKKDHREEPHQVRK